MYVRKGVAGILLSIQDSGFKCNMKEDAFAIKGQIIISCYYYCLHFLSLKIHIFFKKISSFVLDKPIGHARSVTGPDWHA